VISRVKHIHIRDCSGRQRGPGAPHNQANGRGDIDLVGYIRTLHEHSYAGPVDLEIIGTKAQDYSLEQCCIIAAEARRHMQACLQACGARQRATG
jgi:sugar phosphate isomerase/epimerase